MNPIYKVHEWMIIEEGFVPQNNRASESIFSIGNGKLGQRANFEEQYSGDSLQGSYVAGVYYPDKTRVGWWKNGYPDYFAKVLNAANWIGIDVAINGRALNLADCKIISFRRELDMKAGHLTRSFVAEMPGGEQVEVVARRFLSLVRTHTGSIHYSIKALNFNGEIRVTPYIDLDVKNEDANYDEKFWVEVWQEVKAREACITGKTQKLDFYVCTGMKYTLLKNGTLCCSNTRVVKEPKFVAYECQCTVEKGDTLDLFKYLFCKSKLIAALQHAVDQSLAHVLHTAAACPGGH